MSFPSIKLAVYVCPSEALPCVRVQGNQVSVFEMEAVEPVTADYVFASGQEAAAALGRDVLESARQGFHTSVLSCGGSETMLDVVLPAVCEVLLQAEWAVVVSMVAIFRERAFDLLQRESSLESLTLRSHPLTGVYAERLTNLQVESNESIRETLETGFKHRTEILLRMSARSARIHTLTLIHLVQTRRDEAGQVVSRKRIEVILADLAQNSTDQFALRSVISELINHHENVDYARSPLTKFLQNAVGGNCKTTLFISLAGQAIKDRQNVAATLQLAKQVAAVKNSQQECEELSAQSQREALEQLKQEYRTLYSTEPEKCEDLFSLIKELLRREADQQLAESAKAQSECPFLTNLSVEFSGKLKYFLRDECEFGRNGDINIYGSGVEEHHCTLFCEGQKASVQPGRTIRAKVFVNGKLVKSRTDVNHEDRIRIGNCLYFLFIDPQQPRTLQLDYVPAVREVFMPQVTRDLKKNEVSIPFQDKKEALERVKVALKSEEAQLRRLEEERKKQDQSSRISDKERKLREVVDQHKAECTRLEREQKGLPVARHHHQDTEEQLLVAYHLSNEANAHAETLNKKPRFAPEVEDEKVSVRVRLQDESLRLFWSLEKLESRLPDMAAMAELFVSGEPFELGCDPFLVETEDIKTKTEIEIGQVSVRTQNLYDLASIDEYPSVVNSRGENEGVLHVGLILQTREDEINLEALVNQQVTLEISISLATKFSAQKVFFFYSLPGDSKEHKTSECDGENSFQLSHELTMTQELATELRDGKILLKVVGIADDSEQKQAERKLDEALQVQDPPPFRRERLRVESEGDQALRNEILTPPKVEEPKPEETKEVEEEKSQEEGKSEEANGAEGGKLQGDEPEGAKGAEEGKLQEDEPEGAKEGKLQGDEPEGEKAEKGKLQGDEPEGTKEGKLQGDKPEETKEAEEGKSQGDKPEGTKETKGGKSQRDKPEGSKETEEGKLLVENKKEDKKMEEGELQGKKGAMHANSREGEEKRGTEESQVVGEKKENHEKYTPKVESSKCCSMI